MLPPPHSVRYTRDDRESCYRCVAVGNESLPQAREFKYLVVLLTSRGKVAVRWGIGGDAGVVLHHRGEDGAGRQNSR